MDSKSKYKKIDSKKLEVPDDDSYNDNESRQEGTFYGAPDTEENKSFNSDEPNDLRNIDESEINLTNKSQSVSAD